MAENYTYADISSALSKDNNGNFDIKYDDAAVIQSLKNIFSTVPGERVRSSIGSSLVRYLFEPINNDTADDIKDEIRSSVRQYEPRISTLKLTVIPDIDANVYRVTLDFKINNFARPIRFQTNLRAMGE